VNRTIDILDEDDRWWACAEARRFARKLGFSSEEQARLAVCVAELVSNTARHAGRGRLELSEVVVPSGCRLLVEDNGPGIPAIDEAMRDGFSRGRWILPDTPLSERRGLGVGLGTVRRLMSEVRVSARPGGGALIEAVLWRRK